MITLYDSDGHRNVMFNALTSGAMVQANQHIIVHGGEGLVLDPGGHKVYSKLFPSISSILPIDGLKHVFFSHQDPDIIAAANGWLMVTEATAYLSELWMRFIPHFGVDSLVIDRIRPIPDEGMVLKLEDSEILIIPAHFMHSAGNFQVYDPVSKILYTGDLGASLGIEYDSVEDFDAHIDSMIGFHQRYMPGSAVLKHWVKMIESLEIDQIVPQHGAIFPNRDMSMRFIEWINDLSCGLDIMGADAYRIPAGK